MGRGNNMLNKKEYLMLELLRTVSNPAYADELSDYIIERGKEYQAVLDEAYEAAIADDDEGIQTL